MAAKKRTDNRGRLLHSGEMQRKEDNRYLYRYTDLSGKKRTVYALTLVELREKEKEIERDLRDGIDTGKGDMTLNQLILCVHGNKIRISGIVPNATIWQFGKTP